MGAKVIDTHQQVLFGEAGQTISLYCPEGRPSTVHDVQVWEDFDDDTGTKEAALTGSPSIDSVSTTFDAASGISQSERSKLNLTATTGIVKGRQYLATNAYGQSEWVVVERIESGAAVWARNNLLHNYASSDTFVSTLITATIDTTWVSDEDNVSHPLNPRPRYRVAWTYTVDSVKRRAATWLDVVRYPSMISVKPTDVDRLARNWLHRLPSESRAGQGVDVIDEATHQVKLDLWEHAVQDYAMRNNALVNELVRRKAVLLLAEQHFLAGGVRKDLLDDIRAEYTARFESLLERAQAQITDDGTGGTVKRARIYRR